MNYKTIYENLIKTRSNQTLLKEEYYENHHILPKCLGGSDDPQNLIKLTAREHFLCFSCKTTFFYIFQTNFKCHNQILYINCIIHFI